MILTSLHEKSDVISVQSSQYKVLETASVVTPTSTHAFCINGVWCWMLLSQLSIEKTNYIIKQLLTIEILDMTLISTIFCCGYHVISNTSIVNNCIIWTSGWNHICQSSESIHIWNISTLRFWFYSITTDPRVHAMGWGWRSKYRTSLYSSDFELDFFHLRCILVYWQGAIQASYAVLRQLL